MMDKTCWLCLHSQFDAVHGGSKCALDDQTVTPVNWCEAFVPLPRSYGKEAPELSAHEKAEAMRLKLATYREVQKR